MEQQQPGRLQRHGSERRSERERIDGGVGGSGGE